MKTNHTPGPWINKNDEPTFIPLRAHHCEKLGFSIGFVSWEDNDGRGSPLANARLIAAAPDLLEALRNLLEEGEFMDYPHTRQWYAVNAAREAIAKATGSAT